MLPAPALPHLPDDKAAARKLAMQHRLAVHESAKGPAPLRLLAHRFPVTPAPGRACVSAFFPYGTEIDLRPLLGKLAGEGWETCLPVVIAKGQPLVFRRWLPGAPTVTGAMKIEIPPPEVPEVEPDVLLVPLLAFDRQGYRLGYGGGFYDMTLARLRRNKPVIAIGAAYAGQEVARVPHDAHDERLDYVITERELFKCA